MRVFLGIKMLVIPGDSPINKIRGVVRGWWTILGYVLFLEECADRDAGISAPPPSAWQIVTVCR